MVEGEAADDQIELGVAVGKAVGLADFEADVGEPALAAGALGDRDGRGGQVHADDLAAMLRQGHRDVAGTGCDFERAILALRIDRADQAGEAFGVGNHGRRGIGVGLAGKLLAHGGLVVAGFDGWVGCHLKLSGCAARRFEAHRKRNSEAIRLSHHET